MYLTVKQQMNHLTKDEYMILRELCHTAKNLTNQALYNVRQHFFKEKKYLSYNENYHLLKTSDNYKMLNSNMAEQIIREVNGSFQSFFALRKKNDQKARIPHYLDKDGFTTLVIGFVRISGNEFILPYSNSYRKNHKKIIIRIPPQLTDRKIKEIRIIPKYDARFFEIRYTYECECAQRKLNTNKALAIDPGLNNLITAVSSEGRSFIIDGREMKSVNQWYNKENARLSGIKDKQKYGDKPTKRQCRLVRNRNNRINDIMAKAARRVIDYCIANDIGTLVAGYNCEFQRDSDMGKANNQNFVNVPYGKLIKRLQYLCEMNGIVFVRQEESYTSRASFFDHDEIPVYSKEEKREYIFSGKRKHRGLYIRNNGVCINADINGALNILRKSIVVDLSVLYSRGDVDTPERLRVA